MAYNNNYNKNYNNNSSYNNNRNGFNKGTRNNNGKFNNNTDKPRSKPIVKVLKVMRGGIDRVGNEYNTDSLNAILTSLQEADVFTKLSVSVTIAKSLCIGEDAKGVLTVARIQSFDAEHGEMSICFFGKNVEYAEKVNDMVIVPRVRTSRDSKDVSTIFGFEIVPESEIHTVGVN